MSILDQLNEKQKLAAQKIEGQTLILAGAGSGKTRTLTFKIAYMIKEKNIDPKNILALTFTNKAAKEMKERIEKLLGENSKDIIISTFHSFAVKILRIYAERLGFTRYFNIYDTNDQKTLVKKILKNLNKDSLKIGNIVNQISKAKEEGKNLSSFSEYEEFYHIFKMYQENLKKYNAMDFSDLLNNLYLLLENDDILNILQNQYKYILIDEYQDTNNIQYQIVKKITKKYMNICVVGDEDQSIYAFRGANIQNILNFNKDYPEAYIVKLEQNYRSTTNILNVANSVIKNNTSSMGKQLWSEKNKGEKVKLYSATSPNNEASFVADKIKELIVKKNQKYKDFCILYRVNAHSRAFEEIFMRYNMPYKIFGGINFYSRKEIKDLLAYLQIISNSYDDISFERIINTPKRSIGPKTIESLNNIANKNSTSLFNAISLINDEISTNTKNKLVLFKNFIDKIKENKSNITTSNILTELIDNINYIDYLNTTEDSEDRINNVYELINSIKTMEKNIGFLSLEDYLENIILQSSTDNLEDDENYIKLMTIHSSKGLEFKTVFLVGLEQGNFPKDLCDESEEEEERRLFYVGVTRAEEELFLTYSIERNTWGVNNIFQLRPSIFIKEIQPNLIEHIYNPNLQPRKSIENNNRTNLTNFTINNNNIVINKKTEINTPFKIGEFVKHNKFGRGKIKNITENSIIIDFYIGEKKLALSLAEKFLIKVD